MNVDGGIYNGMERRERIFDGPDVRSNTLPGGSDVVTMKVTVEGLVPRRYRV